VGSTPTVSAVYNVIMTKDTNQEEFPVWHEIDETGRYKLESKGYRPLPQEEGTILRYWMPSPPAVDGRNFAYAQSVIMPVTNEYAWMVMGVGEAWSNLTAAAIFSDNWEVVENINDFKKRVDTDHPVD
jgi:hypothetical protein